MIFKIAYINTLACLTMFHSRSSIHKSYYRYFYPNINVWYINNPVLYIYIPLYYTSARNVLYIRAIRSPAESIFPSAAHQQNHPLCLRSSSTCAVYVFIVAAAAAFAFRRSMLLPPCLAAPVLIRERVARSRPSRLHAQAVSHLLPPPPPSSPPPPPRPRGTLTAAR